MPYNIHGIHQIKTAYSREVRDTTKLEKENECTYPCLLYIGINTPVLMYSGLGGTNKALSFAHIHTCILILLSPVSFSSLPSFVLERERVKKAPSHLRQRSCSLPERRPSARSAGPSRQRPGSKTSRRPIFICCLHCCLCHKSSAFWSVAS